MLLDGCTVCPVSQDSALSGIRADSCTAAGHGASSSTQTNTDVIKCSIRSLLCRFLPSRAECPYPPLNMYQLESSGCCGRPEPDTVP